MPIRISRAIRTGLGILLGLAALSAADVAPTDFKLTLGLHGTDGGRLGSGQLVFREGIAYQFLSEIEQEVQIVDIGRSRIVLIDLQRKLQTEITPAALDIHARRLHKSITTALEKREREDGRAGRVAAAMSRDLIEPRFAAEFDAKRNRLHLSNATVEIDALGEPEPDAARLALIHGVLSTLAKLGSMREPTELPPFGRLESLSMLVTRYKLRPTELSMVLRLSGPPKKLRWTFGLVPQLTAREREAIARVERLRATTQFVPFAKYEAP